MIIQEGENNVGKEEENDAYVEGRAGCGGGGEDYEKEEEQRTRR